MSMKKFYIEMTVILVISLIGIIYLNYDRPLFENEEEFLKSDSLVIEFDDTLQFQEASNDSIKIIKK